MKLMIFMSLGLGLELMSSLALAGIEVQGHRGARALRPENTLPGFQYALEQGVDTLELDLAVTKDMRLVVSHDPHINAEICLDPEGKRIDRAPLIHSLTLEEVKMYDCGTLKNPKFPKQEPVPGARIPTLEEVFALVKGSPLPAAAKVGFNIETKIKLQHPRQTVKPKVFSRLVLQAIRESGMGERIVIQSFDHRTLVEARKLDARAKIAALVELPVPSPATCAIKLKADILSPKWNILKKKHVDRVHAEGIRVIPWTANDPEAWQRLIDLKVDGIISDDPAALIAYLKSKGLRD